MDIIKTAIAVPAIMHSILLVFCFEKRLPHRLIFYNGIMALLFSIISMAVTTYSVVIIAAMYVAVLLRMLTIYVRTMRLKNGEIKAERKNDDSLISNGVNLWALAAVLIDLNLCMIAVVIIHLIRNGI